MSTYRLTELANSDVWEIRHRVLEDSGAAVLRRIMIELDAKLKLLCEFPGIGRCRPVGPNVPRMANYDVISSRAWR